MKKKLLTIDEIEEKVQKMMLRGADAEMVCGFYRKCIKDLLEELKKDFNKWFERGWEHIEDWLPERIDAIIKK